MNQKKFNELPELLNRRQVLDCGISEKQLKVLKVLVTDAEQKVPFGKIGAVQLPGRSCTKPELAKCKYRKSDVGKICGYKTE